MPDGKIIKKIMGFCSKLKRDHLEANKKVNDLVKRQHALEIALLNTLLVRDEKMYENFKHNFNTELEKAGLEQ